MDESGPDEAEFSRKLAIGRRVPGAINSLVNAKGLQLEGATLLHESVLLSVLIYGSKTMIQKENERSRIMTL